MFKRELKKQFLEAIKAFPVVILTGARQTGKSTLCKTLLNKTHGYVSLEDPDVRRQAQQDPRTFLKNHPAPVIFDEIQYAPELPSYIQGIVDADRKNYGQYVLTGSQNFLLMEKVSQSLAGRAALMTLYPCNVKEIHGDKKILSEPQDIADWILKGGYPEMRDNKEIDRKTWCASYIRLFIERDIRQMLNVGDLTSFERFVHLLAIRTGQILNLSDLARDTDISVPTAKRWLSVLQASYQVHLLEPFHANLSKRLIKSPKIYFGDTALATYLMGIHNSEVLLNGPFYGALFETAVVLEHIKSLSFSRDIPRLSYFRSKDGLEIDLLIEKDQKTYAREIKTNRTLSIKNTKPLIRVEKLLSKPLEKEIFSPTEKEIWLTEDVKLKPWHKVE